MKPRFPLLTKRLLLLATLIFPLSCQDDLTDEVKLDASDKNNEVFTSFEEAQKIASFTSFDSTSGASNARSGVRIKKSKVFKDRKNRDAFYAFNYEGNKGFSIISADRRMVSVLAHSDSGSFNLDDYQQNPGLMIWLESLTDHITHLRDDSGYRKDYLDGRKYRADARAKEAYSLKANESARKGTTADDKNNGLTQPGPITNILPDGGGLPPLAPDNIVTRLATTGREWGQGCGYNDHSPRKVRSDDCDRAPAGCGPVAVAMVMWYHRNRIGSLTHNGVPVNFNNMNAWYPRPGAFGQSPDVARLMGFIGSQIIIDYAANYAMALPKKIPDLFNFMGFSSSMSDLNYDVVIREIRNRRPVIFKARTPGVLGISFNHHIWVCEGYRINHGGRGGEWFLMNWGWYGRQNGWFHINDWTPGDNQYTKGRKMIIVR